MTNLFISNKALFYTLLTVAFILSIPFVASKLSEQVMWEVGDYFAAAAVIFSAGYVTAIFIENVKNKVVVIAGTSLVVILATTLWILLALN